MDGLTFYKLINILFIVVSPFDFILLIILQCI